MDSLYLDNHLLIADKPWGLLTQPSGTSEDSLESQAKVSFKVRFAKPGAVFLEAVHRIDRVVGGAVLFARTLKALSRLNEAQRNGAIRKTYRARVRGIPRAETGTLEDWLLHDDFQARIVAPQAPGAKLSRLQYRVLGADASSALLEIVLETGRYHQIRAQLSHAGFPILGDVKYGAPVDRIGAPPGGIALYSFRLEFEHPVTHLPIAVESRLKL